MTTGLLLLAATMLILPLLIARWATNHLLRWPRWLIALGSAAVIPAILVFAAAFFVFLSESDFIPEECAVGDCYADFAGGTVVHVNAAGLLLFACSVLVNVVVVYRTARVTPLEHDTIFE